MKKIYLILSLTILAASEIKGSSLQAHNDMDWVLQCGVCLPRISEPIQHRDRDIVIIRNNFGKFDVMNLNYREINGSKEFQVMYVGNPLPEIPVFYAMSSYRLTGIQISKNATGAAKLLEPTYFSFNKAQDAVLKNRHAYVVLEKDRSNLPMIQVRLFKGAPEQVYKDLKTLAQAENKRNSEDNKEADKEIIEEMPGMMSDGEKKKNKQPSPDSQAGRRN